MFPKQIKTMFIFQILAGFSWIATLISAIVFIIGAFVADWSWNLLWISAGGFVITMLLSFLVINRFIATTHEMERGF